MCRMTRPSGNLQRAGVTGRTLTRTVSDLLRSRMPFVEREAPVLPCPIHGADGAEHVPCLVGGHNL